MELEKRKAEFINTMTPEIIEKMIEEKMRKREELSKVENQPIGRV